MTRTGDLRKTFRQDDFNAMVEDLGRSRRLFNFQLKLANYKNKKTPNYFKAVIESKAMLMRRVKNKYKKLTKAQKERLTFDMRALKKSASPANLFNALDDLNRFKTSANNASWRFA